MCARVCVCVLLYSDNYKLLGPISSRAKLARSLLSRLFSTQNCQNSHKNRASFHVSVYRFVFVKFPLSFSLDWDAESDKDKWRSKSGEIDTTTIWGQCVLNNNCLNGGEKKSIWCTKFWIDRQTFITNFSALISVFCFFLQSEEKQKF